MNKALDITVKGRVQGVFFRANTKERAEKLGIKGYVKNLDNGQVKIIAEGRPEQIDRLISWCRIGPAEAEVTELKMMEIPLKDYTDFRIEY